MEGDIENVNGLLKITKIRVKYYLKVSVEQAEGAREAFSSYLHLCPSAQSVIGCINIKDELVTGEITA